MTPVQGLIRFARLGRAHLQRAQRRAGSCLGPIPRSIGIHRAVVVERFNSWTYLQELLNELSAVLRTNGVEHLVLQNTTSPDHRIAVNAADARRVVEVLVGASRSRGWWAARSRDGVTGPARPLGRRRLGRATGLLISRNLISPSGVPLTHSELGVLIEFWRRTEADTPRSAGGVLPAGTLLAPTPNGRLDYVDVASWRRAQAVENRVDQPPTPHLLSVNEPVDLVYTWVDGEDPAWLARKAEALGRPTAASYTGDAALAARFLSRDELRYSLRSAEMFAGWARRIWVVTDRQVPHWLKPDGRLSVVDHAAIFADPRALPVFNSHAIESQLHHIEGLAERYLYLNDDMLFGAPVSPENFFHGNGVSKVFTSRVALIDPAPPNGHDLAVMAAAKNNRRLLEQEFGRTITHKLWHTPQPHSRALMEEFERTHSSLFDTVMRSRLRTVTDYSLTSALDAYYAMVAGRAAPGRIRYGYLDLGSPDMWMTLELWLRRRDVQCLCINDSTSDDSKHKAEKESALLEFFESYYPVPSPWE